MKAVLLREDDPELDVVLMRRYVDRVMELAALPNARRGDVESSAEFRIASELAKLALTCTITGSTYECEWDGSEEAALALADEAAVGTAYLLRETRHYAWLRSRR